MKWSQLISLILLSILFSCSTPALRPEFVERNVANDDSSCSAIVKKIFKSEGSVLSAISKKQGKSAYQLINGSLFKEIDGVQVRIGTPSTFKAHYLFEWQDKEMHDEWIKDGKILKDYMDYVLSEPAQNVGRGYYVSLNPLDSASYGSHLTVFELDKPMIILKNFNHDLYENEGIHRELREMGYAGAQHEVHETWLNIFNEDYLKNAKRMDYSILLNSLDPKYNVSAFDLTSLFSIKSIKDVFKKTHNPLVDKIMKGEVLTEVEEKLLRDLSLRYLTQNVDVFKTIKERDVLLKAYIKSIKDIDELKELIRNGLFWVDAEKQKKNTALIKEMLNEIPNSDSFFGLFDLFDIATIKKSKSEKMSYSLMQAEALKYAKALKKVNLEAVKDSNEFIDELSRMFSIDYSIRDYDVVMGSYQKNKNTIEISSRYYDILSKNNLLSVNGKQIVDGYDFDTEVTYFSLENLEKIKSIFTISDYNKIHQLALTDKAAATKLANTIMLKHMFNPEDFQKIVQSVYTNDEPVNPYTLYKIFISLHPFNDGNGRAGRLYYRWLVTNFFKDNTLNPNMLVNDGDVFFASNSSTVELNYIWNLTRLWVLNGGSEKDIIARAQEILFNEKYHKDILNNLKDNMNVLNNN